MSTPESAPLEPATRRSLWIFFGCVALFAAAMVGLLYRFVVGPGLMGNVVRQRQAQAQTQILELHKELEAWSSRHQGSYPASLAELLGGARELPRDPWGREFVYAPPAPGELRPRLRTLGRDGLPGGADEDADLDREGLVPPGR